MDFVIPESPFDLEIAKPGRLYVRKVLDVEGCADIDAVITSLSDKLLGSSDVFSAILEADALDTYYSLIKCVDNCFASFC